MYRKFNDTIFWHEKSILIVRVSKSTSCRLLKKTENVMFIFMSNLIMVQYFWSFILINTRVSDNYSMTLTFEKNAWSSATYQKGTLKHSIILKIHALIDWALSGIRWNVGKGLHIYRLPSALMFLEQRGLF